jgi:hypothetical protein
MVFNFTCAESNVLNCEIITFAFLEANLGLIIVASFAAVNACVAFL